MTIKYEYTIFDENEVLIIPFVFNNNNVLFDEVKDARVVFVKPNNETLEKFYKTNELFVEATEEFKLKYVTEKYFFNEKGVWTIKPYFTDFEDVEHECKEYNFQVVEFIKDTTDFEGIINLPILEVADIYFKT